MLLTMAVYDTEENDRTWMTRATLRSLRETVDWDRHRLMISDNGSCPATYALYAGFASIITCIVDNGRNLGTANALNRIWRYREPGEHVVKIDNDVVIHQDGWADQMEEVFERDPTIGICGLKRKDLLENPDSRDAFFRSKLVMLPHKPGQRWIVAVVEEVNHVMGTCQAYNSALLDKIGYLYQPGIYGFDDSLAALRARLAGFKCVFLPHIEIDHVDPGGTSYTDWKARYAGEQMAEYQHIVREYQSGARPLYYDGGFDAEP